ncbi:MAG: septum formation initiator family protein [Clostridia bacterium]|nr:septum formation initiator family protein [Clostridia bacterium]
MAVKNNQKRKHSVILWACFFVLVCYFVATIFSLQMQVRAQENTRDDLEAQYNQQVEDNKELERLIEEGNESDYIEKIAREQYGYAKPDERVYYDSSVY